MKNKKLFGVTATLIFFLGGVVFFLFSFKKEVVHLGGVDFQVEIAVTSQEKKRGLSEREDICEKCAMLFLFGEDGKYSFWMKGMRFNLDILWIKDGKISGIEKNILFSSQDTYGQEFMADSVLEIKAGTVDRLGIKIGDPIRRYSRRIPY